MILIPISCHHTKAGDEDEDHDERRVERKRLLGDRSILSTGHGAFYNTISQNDGPRSRFGGEGS